MKFLSIVALILALCLATSAENLLKNGDFESTGIGNTLPGWQLLSQPNFELDAQTVKSGKYSLKLLPKTDGYYALSNIGGKLADFPDEIIVRGYVKTENLKARSLFAGIFTYDEKWGNSLTFPAFKPTPGNSDWTFFEKKITKQEILTAATGKPADKQPVYWNFRINIINNPGTVWLDALEMKISDEYRGAAIYLSKTATAAERFAVNELAAYLRKVTGKTYPVTDWEPSEKSPVIRIGQETGLESQEWHLQSDKTGNLSITGGDAAGTVYGIYEFLEKYLGCAWLDYRTEIVPEMPDWQMPLIDERGKPAIQRREMYAALGGDSKLRLRNKENIWTSFKEIDLWYGSPRANHTFAHYTKDWQDLELFAMNEHGKRIKYSQLCPSNPRVTELIVAQMKEYIKADRAKGSKATLYDLSQNDGGTGICFCPACRKATAEEGAFSGVYIRFMNEVARRVNQEYPEIQVRTLSYSYTSKPPQKAIGGPNLLVTTVNSELFAPLLPGTANGRSLKQWAKQASSLGIWAYWKTFSSDEYPAVKSREIIQEEMKFCRDNNIALYFAENEYSYLRSFFALQYYFCMKLMQNPDMDLKLMTDKFMNGYYGAAASAMTGYVDYLEQRMAEIPYGSKDFLAYLDYEFFMTVERYLAEAEQAAADDPDSLLHVRFERVPVDYQWLLKYTSLASKGDMPPKDFLIKRYEKNASDSIRYNLNASENDRKKIEQELTKVKNETKLFAYLPAPVPEQFKGKEIIDYHWNNFNGFMVDGWLVEEPEAVCGMAFHVNEKIDPSKHQRAAHSLPLEFGFYDFTAKKGETVKLMAGQIPQDEKYHWYKVGRTTILPSIYVWAHWYWGIRIYLNNKNTGIVPEEMDIWISMKATGPAYVKGSTKPNDIFVERLILVK